MSLDGLDHVAITVGDIKRSVAWYHDILGLERRYEGAWGDDPAVMEAGSSGVALFQVQGNSRRIHAGSHRLSMQHFAFRADRTTFEALSETLERKGVRTRQADNQIAHSLYFNDPDGYMIEVTTYDV
jgi:catechol 2,3-dioxygenase-like lactoylglutathione lyase family enzyme